MYIIGKNACAAMAVSLCCSFSACVYTAPDDDAPDAVAIYDDAAEPAPELAVAEPVDAVVIVHPVDGTPAPELAPLGAYCGASVGWTFTGDGRVEVYSGGRLRRGDVLRADDVLAIRWSEPCTGGAEPACERVDSWPLVTTATSITVGGVTAVAETAGGCDQ